MKTTENYSKLLGSYFLIGHFGWRVSGGKQVINKENQIQKLQLATKSEQQ
jgi:hypothetical protein